MKKLYLIILTAGLLSGCGIDYDGSTKIIFKGRVTGPNEEPLEGIKVTTQVSDGNDRDDIGYDITDSNGNYLMIFPKANEEVDIQLIINSDENTPNLSQTRIVYIDFEDLQDYTIDFGTQSLYNTENSVEFHIAFEMSLPRKIEVLGMIANKTVDYNFQDLPTDPSYWYETDFFVAPNQVLTLRILGSDGAISEVQVPIGEDDVTYTL